MPEAPRRLRAFLGVAGGLLLIVGTALPFWGVSFGNEHRALSFIGDGRGDGILIVILSLVSFWMIHRGKCGLLWIPATIALGLLAWTWRNLHAAREKIIDRAGGDEVRSMPEYVMNLGKPEWGWVVMLAGVALLYASAISSARRPSSN